MAKTINDLVLDANKLIGKKKYKKALGICIQVCEARPKDYKTWIKVGDCLKQIGDGQQALKIYARTANSLAAEGQLMQAIAVNKLILEIDPNHTSTQSRLAKLYSAKETAVKQEREALNDELERQAAGAEFDKEFTGDEVVADSDADASDGEITTHRFDVALNKQTAADESDEDVQKRLASIPETPLFSELLPEHFAAIIPKLGFKRVQESEFVIREGDQGNSLFIIADGHAKVAKKGEDGKDVFLGTMGPGAFFGEVALFEGGIRSASVIATEQLSLLEISQDHLYELTAEFPQIESVMDTFYQQRLLRSVLRFSDPFKAIPEGHLMSAIKRFKHAEVGAGVTVQASGNVTSGLIVIESGTLNIHGSAGVAGSLGTGDYLGLGSFLKNQPDPHTYESATDIRLFNLPRDVFAALVKKYPDVLEQLKKKV